MDMKAFVAVFCLCVLSIVGWFFFFHRPQELISDERIKIQIRNHTIIAEVAKTEEQKETGLAGRTALGLDEGMLFPFSEKGRYGFWMKGMQIPIDIVWILGTTVVGFEENISLPSGTAAENSALPIYFPPGLVDKVLELRAGSVRMLGIQRGDMVTFIEKGDR